MCCPRANGICGSRFLKATVEILRIFLFSTISDLEALILLPAIRCGTTYVNDSGTPWPWFPWTVFGLLAVGVIISSDGLILAFLSGVQFLKRLWTVLPYSVRCRRIDHFV